MFNSENTPKTQPVFIHLRRTQWTTFRCDEFTFPLQIIFSHWMIQLVEGLISPNPRIEPRIQCCLSFCVLQFAWGYVSCLPELLCSTVCVGLVSSFAMVRVVPTRVLRLKSMFAAVLCRFLLVIFLRANLVSRTCSYCPRDVDG